MKKTALISSLVVMLVACSVSDVTNLLAPPPTLTLLPSATNTLYLTPTDTPTITETLPTPTYTGTPTQLGGGFTDTPTLTLPPPTETPTSAPSGSPDNLTLAPGSLLTTQYVGFTQIRISSSALKWGGCEPSSVTFTARVSDPATETGVLLFLRLSSPTTGEITKWEAGANMIGDKNGTFTYTVTTRNVSHITEYPNGWLHYQLKAINKNLKIVGYTQVFSNNIAVSKCSVGGTPTSTLTEAPPTDTPTLSQ
jgi:hypothetical protein